MKTRFIACFLTASINLFPYSANALDAQLRECIVDAGQKYQISPYVIQAIIRVESMFDPYAYEKLPGSESRGIMQINSYWYNKIAKFGITPDDLWDPCINIHVGAWILAQEVRRYGNTWTAVGAYNSGAYTPETRERKISQYKVYADKVYKALYGSSRK